MVYNKNLEYRTGCLKPSDAFLIGDNKSGLTVHSASYNLTMCGKFNGCCYVYDVQHILHRLLLFEAKCCLSYRMSKMVSLECMVLLTSK